MDTDQLANAEIHEGESPLRPLPLEIISNFRAGVVPWVKPLPAMLAFPMNSIG